MPAQAKPKPLTGDSFLAFNQQLAHLTAAGMPVEQGLRLIAGDMESGRLAGTVREIAADLEAGMPLDRAFERHAGHFPPLYGRLIAAGVKTNSLPAMLFNLGRHMELLGRVRSSLWMAAAYPLMVLAGLIVVLLFLSYVVLPKFADIFVDFRVDLPDITKFAFWLGRAAPYLVVALAVLLVLVPVVWQALRKTGEDRKMADAFLLPLPVVGPVLRLSMIARWCDALRLSVEAGLDLPQGMRLAAEAVGSPKVGADTTRLIEELQSGRGLPDYAAGVVLPPTVSAAIQFARRNTTFRERLRA